MLDRQWWCTSSCCGLIDSDWVFLGCADLSVIINLTFSGFRNFQRLPLDLIPSLLIVLCDQRFVRFRTYRFRDILNGWIFLF